MAWEFLNKAGNVADLASLFFDFKNWNAISKFAGLFAKKKTAETAEVASGAGPSGPAAAPAAPTPVAESVDSWGTANNKAIAMLETMLSIEPAPGPFGGRPLTVSAEQREAFHFFAKLLTYGEGQALENVFALALGEKGWIKLTWLAPAATPGGAPLPRRKSYETWMRPRGVRIYRAIADDILIAPTPAGRLARAKRLVEQMRRFHVLDNLQDDAIAAARQAKLLVSQADSAAHELRAQQKLGFDARLWAKLWSDPKLVAKRSEIEAAEPLAAVRLHEEYQALLQERTTALVKAELRKRRWRVNTRVTTVRGFNIPVPVVRPGKVTATQAIRYGAALVVVLFITILAINA